MTLVFMIGGALTVSPVAAFFSFVPVILVALLAVTYVRSIVPTERSPTSGRGRQTA